MFSEIHSQVKIKMPVATGVDAFVAFERQLRTLCLDEFPCGTGSWRTASDNRNPATQFSSTLRDYGAGKEQEETLEELVTSKYSPYSVDYTWSKEARQLREVAVKSPWLITRDFILDHFQTMKIVDKNVCHIDSRMLQFPRLTELTVSANMLHSVNSRNLPITLQVLELVANEISDLEPLCNAPPPGLIHLGLGLNRISAIHDYLTGPYWPKLLSLDLSYNNLCDFKEVICKLQTLPKLRNLVLIGNPLALLPGYRGYTIDSLRNLTILDDMQISADEKHHFKGLARRREFVRNEAKLMIKLRALSGIPMPPELQATEELPDFPIITRTYYVEFQFLEDFMNSSEKEREKNEEQEKEAEVEEEKEAIIDQTQSVQGAQGEGEPVPQENGHVEENGFQETRSTVSDVAAQPDAELEIPGSSDGKTGEAEAIPSPDTLKLVPFRTDGLTWAEEGMELVYEREIQIDDLPALKELFKKGLDIDIKEDKVLSYPAEDDGRASVTSKKGGKDAGKADKRGASVNKDKAKDSKPAKDDGKKKKKKEPEIELIHMPAEVTVLGSYHLATSEIVNGETRIEQVCICGGGSLEAQQGEEKEDEVVDGKKDKKKKDGGESAKGKKGKDAKTDKDKGKKPGKGDGKDAKKDAGGKGGKRPNTGVTLAGEDEDDKPPPPPPLTVTIELELVQWKTAQESIPKLPPPAPPTVHESEDGGGARSEVQTS